MRRKRNPQTTIFEVLGKHPGPRELEQMDAILATDHHLLDQAYADLLKKSRSDTGRQGMTAEQVVRCTLLKQFRELSYDDLAYYLADSHSFRSFVRLEPGHFPAKSTLQENIKALSEEAWLAIHQFLLAYAQQAKIENGRKIRLDSTAVQTDIHRPTDATLLWDGIRVITRWLFEGKELSPCPGYGCSDHRRVVKKRLLSIQNATKQETRQTAYRDMLHYAGRVIAYAEQAIPELADFGGDSIEDYTHARALAEKLSRAIDLLRRVMDQTERRVFKGEQVPASEKIVSLFETHTDILVKGRRETEFGHKVFLTGGASNLILDCLVERGNPADAERFLPLLKRHIERYGRPPRQSTADGGFASQANLAGAKAADVKDVVFAKKRGLSIVDMAKSTWVYRRLRNFRAGIEANISTLKRSYGLKRCNWSGWEGFKAYIWSAIVAYNLTVLARIQLATA
ncbi:ISNCY family transposase [Desulfofustis limnaeus]|jgi:IS5 family transposase|uniref:Transposase n=1 Tax=Desulfofustis limnaeus TaxID=2740163 RepID=A0ABM7W8U7_9BACT|nr:ISNCY family transposase [Desulfofustis limnaeus]BDD86073.1 transposase [Desulfofustis limnaeus]BDD86253.1 transposase [Desulfofustis limnaeus]BDD87016.1 transposase [Desulfofustis limnaeus]BDD87324.1 transposase [Desulfofustis limnaeus]BDD88001.1 transposase [Desulfofustis limnaeus]